MHSAHQCTLAVEILSQGHIWKKPLHLGSCRALPVAPCRTQKIPRDPKSPRGTCERKDIKIESIISNIIYIYINLYVLYIIVYLYTYFYSLHVSSYFGIMPRPCKASNKNQLGYAWLVLHRKEHVVGFSFTLDGLLLEIHRFTSLQSDNQFIFLCQRWQQPSRSNP